MAGTPDIAVMLAQANRLRLAGRGAEAERICRAILDRAPFTVPALHMLALLLGNRGELSEATTLMRRALAIAPQDASLSNSLGNILFKGGDAAAAEAAYSQAIALKPDYAEAHYNRGLMLRELGRTDDALVSQRRAAALKPGYAEALAQAGALLSDKQQYDDALAALDQALTINPRYFDALYYRGLVLSKLHRHLHAIVPLQAACELRPQSHEAHYALGNTLNYLNRESEALAAYRKAIEAAPGFALAHKDYNALAWAMDRKDLQFASYAFARRVAPQNPDLLLAEAEQRMHLEDFAMGEMLLRQAAELAPQRTDIGNALGRALISLGRLDEGIALFEQAVAADPRDVAHHRELSIALLHGGKAARALPILEQAYVIAPFDQFILALQNLAWRETGDPRHRAATDMEKYVRVYDLPPPPGFGTIASFNNELAEELAKLHSRKVEPHDQTLRGGSQTMGHLFMRASRNIALLRDRIGEAIADYIARMPDDPGHPVFGRKQAAFSYFGSWSCRLRSNGFHTNHVHPQGWISSAYYVSLPDAVTDPAAQQGWLKFGESNFNLGERDRPAGTVQPAVGRLVLFPSYFWHGTVPFRSDQTRLTVAFDVVPGEITR